MKDYKEAIEAVILILNGTNLRVDQAETAARLKACSMKLQEILEGVNQDEADNQ